MSTEPGQVDVPTGNELPTPVNSQQSARSLGQQRRRQRERLEREQREREAIGGLATPPATQINGEQPARSFRRRRNQPLTPVSPPIARGSLNDANLIPRRSIIHVG